MFVSMSVIRIKKKSYPKGFEEWKIIMMIENVIIISSRNVKKKERMCTHILSPISISEDYFSFL